MEALTAPGSNATLPQWNVAVTILSLSLIDHLYGNDEFERLIIVYFALRSIRHGGSWVTPDETTTWLAAIIKLARLFIAMATARLFSLKAAG